MSRTKDQWLEETGGFRLGEAPHMVLVRRRFAELTAKLKSETGLTEAERQEFLRLHDELPDDDAA